jgi:hypothetical protein
MCNQQVNRYHLSIAVSDAMRVFGVSGNGIACRVPRKRMLDRGDYYATRIMQIKRKDVVGIQVYNLHTETNTYQVNNVAVHNCGLDVGPDGKGRSRKAEHLIDREYTDKNGNQSVRKSTTARVKVTVEITFFGSISVTGCHVWNTAFLPTRLGSTELSQTVNC